MSTAPPPVTPQPPGVGTFKKPDNLPKGHCGYYNPHRFPVTFTSNFANRGPAEIGPGEAVTDGQGRLVEYDPDLERQVTDKMLKRILPGDSRYKDFMQAQKQADKRGAIVTQPATEAAVGPKPIAPEPILPTEEPKVDYTEEDIDGVHYFIFQGKQFTSKSALNAFVRSLGAVGS